MMRTVRVELSVAIVAMLPDMRAASFFTVTSTSIKDGARVPPRFAADDPKRPCSGERVWLVTFMRCDLGYFDDETCRLEPIENPFAPKLLPMSPE